MKITKLHLRKIIKEELARVLEGYTTPGAAYHDEAGAERKADALEREKEKGLEILNQMKDKNNKTRDALQKERDDIVEKASDRGWYQSDTDRLKEIDAEIDVLDIDYEELLQKENDLYH